MGRIAKRSYESCPIVEEFHIQNVLGACEKRQWIIGARVSIALGTYTKALTYTSLSGGLWDTLDHAQVFAQILNAAPTNRTRITSKTSSGFTLIGGLDSAISTYSIVVMGTLPNRPGAQAKWAKDYCPYCKNLNYNAILGSSLKDVAVFSGVVQNGGGGTVAVTFANLTATNVGATGVGSTYPESAGKTQGSQRSSLVTMMADDQYQIIITKSQNDNEVVTTSPYPSSITEGGFTLTGDASKYYDVLIVGQVNY